jgi:hypothetical protein
MKEHNQEVMISINPPPQDRRCDCCRRHINELKPFGKAGDPLVGDFDGSILVRIYRTMEAHIPEYDEILKLVKDWDGLFKTNKELADQLSFYDQLVSTVQASWECRDCIILDDKEWFDLRDKNRMEETK